MPGVGRVKDTRTLVPECIARSGIGSEKGGGAPSPQTSYRPTLAFALFHSHILHNPWGNDR